jgi:transketolase
MPPQPKNIKKITLSVKNFSYPKERSQMNQVNDTYKDWFSAQPEFQFKAEKLSRETHNSLTELGRVVRGDILTMTTVASSGHPGGPMSSADLYVLLYSLSNIHPKRIDDSSRDRIVVSHGHTSAGCYSVLGRLGFFNTEDALIHFRRCGSVFEGHVEREIPGCEWTTGNLGQGLSAGCGFALASKINKLDFNVFVLMSDAEQAKGQVAEARRFATQYNLSNLTVLVDYNKIQISGATHDVMNVNIKENYLSDGWKVLEVNGHKYDEIYHAVRESLHDAANPFAILCHTIMGKGVSFMEKAKEYYHGRPLKQEECQKALEELKIENRIEEYKKKREIVPPPKKEKRIYFHPPKIITGDALNYGTDDKLGNRDAFGKALENLAVLNKGVETSSPIAAFDCDLKESVRTHLFEKVVPQWFFQSGVQEHNTATIAGVLSTEGILTFFADFGVFGIDEVYNQQRLNAINHTNLKVVITHSGVNVGQDGKTHHCIDYLGLARNIPDLKVIVPADPNQTDRVIRYISREDGNFLVVTGRSKNPIIIDQGGNPLFSDPYSYKYGQIDIVRKGTKGVIMTYGASLQEAILAWDELKEKNIDLDIWNISAPFALSREDVEKAIFKGPVISFEDHLIFSGLGAIVGNLIAESGMGTIFKKIGIDDFAPSGSTAELYCAMGIDRKSLVQEVIRTLEKK